MAEMDSILTTVKDIKREGECCCCFSKEDLFSLLEPYNFEDNVEIYSTMIAECFRIELNSYIEEYNRNLYLICKNCVFRLRDAITFRSQIQTAYDRLQAQCYTKDNQGVISSEYSDVIETKEQVLKYDILEYDMDVHPGASLSNESELKLKPMKIVSEKNDNKTIKNVPVVSNKLKKSSDVYNVKSQPSNMLYAKHTKINRKKCFCCDWCDKSYDRMDSLMRHTRQAHFMNIEKFVCDICKKYYRQKESLRNHIMLHMGIVNIKCKICQKIIFSKAALERHMKSYHATVLSCDRCDKSYGNINSLRQHMKVHLKEKDWTCNICGKTLSSQRAFEDHTSMHSGVKNKKCKICEETFVTRAQLRSHKSLHFNPNKQACKYCNKEFEFRANLLDHEKIHSDKKLTCDYCKKGFRRKLHLTQHILLHMGIKNVKCDLCDKCFVSKISMASHKRTCHSFSLSCNICGKTLSSKSSFDNHVLMHSGVKDQKCEICEKAFFSSKALARHMKTHLNKKKIYVHVL